MAQLGSLAEREIRLFPETNMRLEVFHYFIIFSAMENTRLFTMERQENDYGGCSKSKYTNKKVFRS